MIKRHVNLELNEEDELEVRRQNRFHIKLPWGEFNLRGMGLIIVVLMLIIMCLMTYALWRHMEDSTENQKRTIEALNAFSSTQLEMNYLISLGPEEKSLLKLTMPDSLRKRLRPHEGR